MESCRLRCTFSWWRITCCLCLSVIHFVASLKVFTCSTVNGLLYGKDPWLHVHLRWTVVQWESTDVHRILLYMENNYFCFSMHSSSLYSIFMNWLCEHPRIHEYYTSSVWCHTTSRLEPVSLTSSRLRQIKLDDSSSHKYCHVTSRTWSHAFHEDISVYVKPVIATWLDMVKCSRRNSQSPTHEDEAEILTPHKVVFKHYALHSKRIPYIWVSEDVIYLALH